MSSFSQLFITQCALLSPIGETLDLFSENLRKKKVAISFHEELDSYGAKLSEESLAIICKEDVRLDRTVQMALACAKRLDLKDTVWGVNIGSSRGATSTLESSFDLFREQGVVPTTTSPQTTLGNIASTISRTLDLDSISFSHSVTCSTALHALLNACAWIKAGMCSKFIIGGVEAALTPFTVAQMRALRLMPEHDVVNSFPCRPLSGDNSLVLGEGGALFTIEESCNDRLATIAGLGWGIDPAPSLTGISPKGEGFVTAMQMACQDIKPDLIILHAPGTARGDQAELFAIKTLFGDNIPFLASPKWQFGHTFGAAGALSLATALSFFTKSESIQSFPYTTIAPQQTPPPHVNSILINGAGFGGNVVSILLTR